MIHIVGDSHAPEIFRQAARHVGLPLCSLGEADLVIIAQDCPTNPDGSRDLTQINQLVYLTLRATQAVVVLTTQVPPGFTRKWARPNLYHQAETLRIKDALERAITPEQHIIGCLNPSDPLPLPYWRWIERFPAPVHRMSYEEAEFCKIAINVNLAHQVTLANVMAEKAAQLGCDWNVIRKVLNCDHRIGKYTEPGDWRQSPHLLRDYVTFHETL